MARVGSRIMVKEEDEVASTAPRRRFRGQRAPRLVGASTARKNKYQHCVDLEGEVRRRDEEIAALRSGRLADQEALNRARDELEEMRRIYQADMRMHSERSDTLRMENAGLKAEIEVLTREFNAEAVIEKYADVIKSKGSTPASEYGSRLQSELCKAAHLVEVLNDQAKVVKRTCDEKVKNLEEELSQLVHEKGQREANLMKERRALHSAKRAEISSYQEEIRQKQVVITDLEEKLDAALERANHERAAAFDASNSDASLALNAFKQQIDELSRGKEAVEHGFKQKLKSRDETIALLKEVNAANEEHLELLRGDIEKYKNTEGSDDVNTEAPEKKDESAAALLVFMGSLAKATATLEGNVQASLNRKRRLMGALGTNGSGDQVSAALPSIVELDDNEQLLARQPSMLSITSEMA